jgi:hypothetical protein
MVLAFLSFYIWQSASSPVVVASEEDRMTEVVLSAMPQLLERWQEGDREGKFKKSSWACGNLPFSPHVAPAFLKCQPRYLECWARGEAGVPGFLSVTLGDKKYEVRLRKSFPEGHLQWVTRSELGRADLPIAGALVDVDVKGLGHWPMILEDTCRDTYLPERIYSYGARPERDTRPVEMMWDNIGRKIFIDKFLVSNADVELWRKKPAASNELALPAIDLTNKEQEAYCAWRGARRMEAALFDAATMTPADLSRPTPEFIVKPWLPWTRDRRGTFFEKALQNPDWKPTATDCSLAFVAGCDKVATYQPHHTDNVAWSGIFQVLGGEAEIFRNPIEPDHVARLSSRRLPANDDGHQLGRRVGRAIAAGFRCYREVFP